MIIYLQREAKAEPVRRIDGVSSISYPFMWNQGTGRYEYRPKNQAEIDDIFLMTSHEWNVLPAPVLEANEIGVATAKATAPAPILERRDYELLRASELRSLAKKAGLTLRATDDDVNVRRLLDAYFLGAAARAMANSAPKDTTVDVPVDDDASVPVDDEPAVPVDDEAKATASKNKPPKPPKPVAPKPRNTNQPARTPQAAGV